MIWMHSHLSECYAIVWRELPHCGNETPAVRMQARQECFVVDHRAARKKRKESRASSFSHRRRATFLSVKNSDCSRGPAVSAVALL